MSYSNKKQCERRTEVRANDVRVKKARNQFLVWLLISLIDEEQPTCLDESLTSKEKADIYEKIGIQIDLVNLGNYKAGQLKTAWEELSDAVTKWLGSYEELAKPAE
ncbi:hypothetical protein CEP51_012641 [Fusarium floridanum]|uniref:Uncharacterized protein n=1 Tax=Fusarium floridanum TaxID=1325733 RepID=A0A428QQN7_9HYPO|nr:hypothetical protein CEP51_012641 [Fusarium floridanum]